MKIAALGEKPNAGNPHMRMVERMLVILTVALSGVSATMGEVIGRGTANMWKCLLAGVAMWCFLAKAEQHPLPLD